MALIRDDDRFGEWIAAWKRHVCDLINSNGASQLELDMTAAKMADEMATEGTVEDSGLAVEAIRKASGLIAITWKNVRTWFPDRKSWAEETVRVGDGLVESGLVRPETRDKAVMAIERGGGRTVVNGCEIPVHDMKFFDWHAELPYRNDARMETFRDFIESEMVPGVTFGVPAEGASHSPSMV